MKKIVICGGHLTPALALIEELEKEKEIETVFFGRKFATEGSPQFSQEYKIITAKKIKFYSLKTGRLQRKMTRYTIPSLLKLPLGFAQAFTYLNKEKPDLVVSFGSYLSTPVVVCAGMLKIKSITHEQSISPGIATKINSRFCEKIFLSWPQSAGFFPGKNVQVIGNLARKSIFEKKAESKEVRDFLDRSQKLLLISGGNQGSHFINKLVFNSLDLLHEYSILHQVGSTNFAGDLDKAKSIKNKNYFPVEFLTDNDFGAVLNKTGILIGRSGVNTLWDCLLLSIPAIFIPLSKEQCENAKTAEDYGFAKVIKQEEAEEKKLKITIGEIFANYQDLKIKAQKAGEKIQKNAVGAMLSEIKKLLK